MIHIAFTIVFSAFAFCANAGETHDYTVHDGEYIAHASRAIVLGDLVVPIVVRPSAGMADSEVNFTRHESPARRADGELESTHASAGANAAFNASPSTGSRDGSLATKLLALFIMIYLIVRSRWASIASSCTEFVSNLRALASFAFVLLRTVWIRSRRRQKPLRGRLP